MTGLRERKRAHARQLTVAVALNLFTVHGYAGVTVNDVCAAADIAPRTFFRYFPTKEHLLVTPVEDLAERLVASLSGAPAELDDAEVLRRALRELGEHVVAAGEQMVRLLRLLRSSAEVRTSPALVLEEHEHRLADRLVRRRDAAAVPDWRTRLMVAQVLAGFRIWLDDLATGSPDDALGHLDELLAAC
jgi:AcrR family transcriptional regulator